MMGRYCLPHTTILSYHISPTAALCRFPTKVWAHQLSSGLAFPRKLSSFGWFCRTLTFKLYSWHGRSAPTLPSTLPFPPPPHASPRHLPFLSPSACARPADAFPAVSIVPVTQHNGDITSRARVQLDTIPIHHTS